MHQGVGKRHQATGHKSDRACQQAHHHERPADQCDDAGYERAADRQPQLFGPRRLRRCGRRLDVCASLQILRVGAVRFLLGVLRVRRSFGASGPKPHSPLSRYSGVFGHPDHGSAGWVSNSDVKESNT